MEFLITAYDGRDSEAMSRRMTARSAHLELGNKMILEGTLLYAAAILHKDDTMIGSLMVVDFPSRHELDKWLKVEPYATGGVRKEMEVKKCRPGPALRVKEHNKQVVCDLVHFAVLPHT